MSQVQTDAYDCEPLRPLVGGFNQDATEFLAFPPQVVGPLQADVRVQGFCQRQPKGQRQTGEVAALQGQAHRKGQRRLQMRPAIWIGVAEPGAPLAAPPGALALCDQQHRRMLTLAYAAHQFAVGRIHFGHHLHAQPG